jgi:hypothetical protein
MKRRRVLVAAGVLVLVALAAWVVMSYGYLIPEIRD